MMYRLTVCILSLSFLLFERLTPVVREGSWNDLKPPVLARNIPNTSLGPIRIVQITGYDRGEFGSGASGDLSIDIVQNSCSDPGVTPEEQEPFFDTVVGLSVLNRGTRTLRFDHFRYTLRKNDGATKTFRSRRISFVGVAEVPVSEEPTEIFGLFLQSHGGFKYLTGDSDPLDESTGLRNIRFRISGIDTEGRVIIVRAKTAFVLRDVDRCS